MIAKNESYTNKKVKKESFMQGVLALMFSQVFIKLLGYVYRCYLTNRSGFGDRGNAIYSAGYNIYALLLTLSSVGVPNAISKLVSEKTTKGDERGVRRIFRVALATFSAIGLIGTLILLFGAKQISKNMGMPDAEMVLVVLSPALFFVAICSVFRGYFNGQSQIKVTANSQTLEQLFKTTLTILFVAVIAVFSNSNTVIMAAAANLATTFSTFLSFAYLYMFYKTRKADINANLVPQIKVKQESVGTIVKRILSVSIPISLSSMMSAINKNIDSFTVVRSLKTFMSEAEAKAQYGILSGKVDTLTSLPLSFNIAFATALVPALSAARAKKDSETAEKRVSFSLLVTMLIGLPCTIGMFIFAAPILNLLFPNANQGELILQISSLTIIFTVLAQTVNGALQGIGKVMVPATAFGIGVAVKCILNIILVPIPWLGACGAAIGSVVCHIIHFTIGFSVLKKNIKLNLGFTKFILKPLLATIMMSICSYAIYIVLKVYIAERLATTIALLVAVLIYTLALLVLKIFNKEEIYMLPYGKKIYKTLCKLGFYKDKAIN